MWRFKETDEEDDICMAAAGFIFLASNIKKEAFWGEANIE
jgi:hypothetical protein